MSVAEQTLSERAPRSPQAQLALESFLGAAYVLLGLGLVFGGLPTLWDFVFTKEVMNEFLSGALLIFATILAMVGLGFFAYRLEKTHELPGLRAGIAMASVLLFFTAWIGISLGNVQGIQDLGEGPGIFVTLFAVACLLFGIVRLFLVAGFHNLLLILDDQGWFHANSFKPNQGLRVRRATFIGVLALGLCGIIVLVSHKTLGTDRLGPNDWYWLVPSFGNDVEEIRFVPLLTKVHVTVPLFLFVALVWFGWRITNWPVFADFLIATEAEMNKVSWTTRKRLFQDTIVVLVTVFLLTTFLFFVDILWIKVLGNSWIGVLQVDVRAEQMKQQEKTQW